MTRAQLKNPFTGSAQKDLDWLTCIVLSCIASNTDLYCIGLYCCIASNTDCIQRNEMKSWFERNVKDILTKLNFPKEWCSQNDLYEDDSCGLVGLSCQYDLCEADKQPLGTFTAFLAFPSNQTIMSFWSTWLLLLLAFSRLLNNHWQTIYLIETLVRHIQQCPVVPI